MHFIYTPSLLSFLTQGCELGPITHMGRLLQRYTDHPGVARMPQNHPSPSEDDQVRYMRSGKARTKDLAWGGVRDNSE